MNQPARIEFYRDKRKLWRWRVRAQNGHIMADSGEGYTRQHSARKSAARVVHPVVLANEVK